ncbi:MAG: hypothetical protein EHM59_18500 [Betaproteobacteria bacterium]|nr:MAG: hypothetical protein EHM59_18500 [Betaproteobacteria bacterium]
MTAALAAASVVGCVELKKFAAPEPPAVTSEWRELLGELRSFERRIGFRATKNFASFSTDRKSYPFCGQSSNRLLPYSYQDPAIRWLDAVSEDQCRDVGADTDVYFGEVEAWGEIGTPVTAAMLASTLDRFVYLIIHEDCHDQFQLPYGIEEPLCDIITHRAMAAFSSEKFRWYAIENRAIKNYARIGSRHVRSTIAFYGELEALYRRYERGEMTHDVLLSRRAQVFARAERAMELPAGQLNNINLANYMTYSRHYPTLERVADRLGPEIESVMEFFRHVDRVKPSADDIMKRHRITEQKSVAFVRAYEAALIETIDQVWAQRSSLPSSG